MGPRSVVSDRTRRPILVAYLYLEIVLGPGEPPQPLDVCHIAAGCPLKKFHCLTWVTGQSVLAVHVVAQFQTKHDFRGVAGLSQSLHVLYQSQDRQAGHGDTPRLAIRSHRSLQQIRGLLNSVDNQCELPERGPQGHACLAHCLHRAPALPPNDRFKDVSLQGGVRHT